MVARCGFSFDCLFTRRGYTVVAAKPLNGAVVVALCRSASEGFRCCQDRHGCLSAHALWAGVLGKFFQLLSEVRAPVALSG